MRALTQAEIKGVQPDATTKPITVTGYPPGDPGVGEPGGGGGSGGTGGLPNTGPATPGVNHITPGGNQYRVGIPLSVSQTKELDKIIDYGIANGVSDSNIIIAADQAYYESSFNQSATNGSFVGLFQYNQATWSQNGEAGSINSDADQIAAIYNDIANYQTRYNAAYASNAYGIATDQIDFADYFEDKHHFGNNATNWLQTDPSTGQPAITGYNNASSTLGIGIAVISHP